jgi:integrase
MAKRRYRTGSIEERGKNTYRLRHSIEGKRYKKTITADSKSDAQKELRRLLKAGDGSHVTPSKITVGKWIEQWLAIGAPGRKQEEVSERTKERYAQLLNEHVKPVLGDRPLQELQATEIEELYDGLKTKVSPWTKRPLSKRTQRHVHVVFGAALATAVRTGLLSVNPMGRTAKQRHLGLTVPIATVDGSPAMPRAALFEPSLPFSASGTFGPEAAR